MYTAEHMQSTYSHQHLRQETESPDESQKVCRQEAEEEEEEEESAEAAGEDGYHPSGYNRRRSRAAVSNYLLYCCIS